MSDNLNDKIFCGVTILNSIRATTIHTWLQFNFAYDEGETPLESDVSLMPQDRKCAIRSNRPAILGEASSVHRREGGYDVTHYITEDQFMRMRYKIKELAITGIYVLSPGDGAETWNQYNCLTACREILKAGDINYLNDVFTPFGLFAKILHNPPSFYRRIDYYARFWAQVPQRMAILVEGYRLRYGYAIGSFIGGVRSIGVFLERLYIFCCQTSNEG